MNRRSSLVQRRLIVAGFVVGTGFHAWQAMANVGGEAASVAAPGHLSAADYDRAARVLDSTLRGKVRNAMVAPFTVMLLQINWLIGGVVVTELVFAYPGFGRMLLDAALFGDISLIGAATLIALLVATATQLLSDIGYRLLDPQSRR